MLRNWNKFCIFLGLEAQIGEPISSNFRFLFFLHNNKNSEEKNSHEFKFLSNQSHLIVTLNIINIRTKKNNSLSIFDLIGFKPNQKDELKQLSLSYLMQFFNEIIANRDQISKFKNEFLKKNKVLSNNILSFPSLNNKNLNFINLFAKHWFNSYCMIFAHGSLKTDLYRECHFFLDKLAE